MGDLGELRSELRNRGDQEKARLLRRFFKTGPGEYAEGDLFLGINVPVLRALARRYRDLREREILCLLRSAFHEERLLSLLILILKYDRADAAGKERIYRIYLKHAGYINNWDLVDATAKRIVGAFLNDKDKAPLHELARSSSLWERRIAVLSTFYFIGNNEFDDALKIAEGLVNDPHDLIHKAVGWMLREVGKRDRDSEERFLKKHYRGMPRTMLRYAIELFPHKRRRAYLKGTV